MAQRMNRRWAATYPDSPEDFVQFSLRLFQEVYYRAALWREHEPEAETREESTALHRILRQVEFELGIRPGKRPGSVASLLIRDLRETIWHRSSSPAAGLDTFLDLGSGKT
jgi:hypothetical protein